LQHPIAERLDQMIPRVFHRIWLGGSIPAEYADYGESWVKINPGWKLRTWTEEDLPQLENQWLFDASDAFAQRADIARYEIIYRFGGVYVDCGFEARRPLEELTRDLDFFAGYQGGTVVANGLFGASAQHPVLRQLIDRLPVSALARAHRSIADQTGPLVFSEAARKYCAAHTESARIFPPPFFYPYNSFEPYRSSEPFELAYAVPHWGGSWLAAQGVGTTISRRSLARQPLLSWRAAVLRSQDSAREVPARLRRGTKRLAQGVSQRLQSTGVLPRASIQAIPASDRLLLVRTSHGYPILTPADDLNITPHLVFDGSYEGNAITFLRGVVSKGGRALDVGANIGLFTIALALAVGPGGRVFAYECSPDMCALLEKNLVLNHLEGVCDLTRAAAGSSRGTSTLRFPSSAPSRGSFNVRDFPLLSDIEEVVVPVERVDDRVDELGYLDVVKIDVEGHEVDVLLGMSGLFDRRAVGILIMEFDHRHHAHDWPELERLIVDFVANQGAELYAVTSSGGLTPLALDEVLTSGLYGNLVVDFRSLRASGRPPRPAGR
jgi:inositol phosphorylceramide mannosyltransferase catalytic subunit